MIRHRRALGAIAIAIAALSIVLYARRAPVLVTDSDFALTELYTGLAARGQLQVGAYSRFGWNHPGPLYFYLQAPFYAASGYRAQSLFAVALAINLAALCAIAWVLLREKEGWLAAAIIAGLTLFAWSAPRLLASPWTGHVPVLPAIAFVVIAGAVVAGRATLLPLALVFGSFAAQTHLASAPVIGVLAIAAVAAVARQKSASVESRVKVLAISESVLLVAWALPIVDAVVNRGGNVLALWRFFVARGGGHDLREAFHAWSYGLTGVMRNDFGLPWGGHFSMHGLSWVLPLAIAQVVLVSLVAVRARRAGRRFEAALALCALVASLVGLWAVTRIEGDILDHEIFWLAAVGALNMALIVAAALRALPARRIAAAACVLGLAAAALLGVSHLRGLTSFEGRRTTPRRIPLAHQAIRGYMRDTGARKLLVEMQDSSWSEAAGVVLRLRQDGIPVAVTDAWIPMFTPRFKAAGDEDALITFSPRYGYHLENKARPGNRVLLEADPVYVNALRIEPTRR